MHNSHVIVKALFDAREVEQEARWEESCCCTNMHSDDFWRDLYAIIEECEYLLGYE